MASSFSTVACKVANLFLLAAEKGVADDAFRIRLGEAVEGAFRGVGTAPVLELGELTTGVGEGVLETEEVAGAPSRS